MDDIVMHLDRAEDLFIAPGTDPLSRNEAAIFGEPAVEHIIRHLQARVLPSTHPGITLLLPREQLSQRTIARIPVAIQRYCAAHIQENARFIRKQRIIGVLGLLVGILLSLGIAALAYFLFAILNLTDRIRGPLMGLIGVVMWVIVWTPLEMLTSGWIPAARRNAALRALAAASIRVRPRETTDADPPRAADRCPMQQ